MANEAKSNKDQVIGNCSEVLSKTQPFAGNLTEVYLHPIQVTIGMKCIQHAPTAEYPDRNFGDRASTIVSLVIRHYAVTCAHETSVLWIGMSKEAHAVLTCKLAQGLQIVGSYHRMEMKTHYKKLKNSLYGGYLHTDSIPTSRRTWSGYIYRVRILCA